MPPRTSNTRVPGSSRVGLLRFVEFAKSAGQTCKIFAIAEPLWPFSHRNGDTTSGSWPAAWCLSPVALFLHPGCVLPARAVPEFDKPNLELVPFRGDLLSRAPTRFPQAAAAHRSGRPGSPPRGWLDARSLPGIGEQGIELEPHGRIQAAASGQFPADDLSAFLAA